jgi:hypothetical protein
MSLKTLVSNWCLTRDDLRICPLHRVKQKVVVALHGFGTVVRILRPLIMRSTLRAGRLLGDRDDLLS